ncbi:RTA1-domain-containing protein [Mollisia scopiformis]|uniref:RTA1-domain-containing protein n=1 Tax=Mollisia scopiformis TaxID=149040 RepID=A0A194WUX0_MOLSC|nr:RTA1-domain-containing protein [Mollisia scopiformis]KUJ11459.1 RTA1-domain-containing protein [Mollisia scopiformis]
MSDSDSTYEAYRYNPSLGAAVAFVVLFTSTTTFHLYQMIRTRTWYFIPFVVGGAFEFIGYIGRAISSQQSPNWTIGPYLVQTLFLLLAPALFSASVYIQLGRIILLVDGEDHSIIKKRWLTKIFVTGDVLSFLTQAIGGSIMASGTLSAMHTGAHIIVGGLFIQVVFFGLFMVVAFVFDFKLHKYPTPDPAIPSQKHLKTLYIASILIMIRSLFRVVEYIEGNNGYLLRHEYYLYISDAVLMLGVMVLFNVIHPSEVHALLRGGKVSKGFRMITLNTSKLSSTSSDETGVV